MLKPMKVRGSSLLLLLGASVLGAGCSGRSASDCPSAGTAAETNRFTVDSAGARASAAPASGKDKKLSFKKLGREVKTLDLDALIKTIPAETVRQYDPYYNREKTYRAFPLARVVEIAFPDEKGLPTQEFVLRALDGFTVPMRGSKVFEDGAYVAFEDLEKPGWEPIGQQRANPAPFYLVWAKKDQVDLETHPRPYQLASIEIADFESVFPWTVPKGAADGSPARKGFAIFREQCIHCHAINRQGGRVGPDLNVPKSVVEYRPVDQIKAYIRDPLSFRYSTMPPHPKMTDEDLDALVAYFTAMKELKHDDEKAPQPK